MDNEIMSNLDTKRMPTNNWFERISTDLDALLDRQISYKVIGVPTINLPLRGLYRVATSGPVLSQILIIFLLLAGFSFFLYLVGFSESLLMLIAGIISPITVTFIHCVLMGLRLKLTSILRPDATKTRIYSLLNTCFAGTIVHFVVLIVSEAPLSETIENLLTIGSQESVTLIFAVIVYALVAEFVQFFIFRYLVPVGSPNWQRISQTKRKSIGEWAVFNLWRDVQGKAMADHILIGKHQVPVEEIISISAQGNYINVVCQNAEYFERMPLAQAIELLPSEFGLLLHRSTWIAHGAIESYRRSSDKCEVRLTNGALVKVARNRVKDVTQLLMEMGVERT